MEFLSVETDFSQSHFLISGMRFPILSCLRLLCLLVELEALPEALLPQTGLVQIIPTHQPRLKQPVLSSLLPRDSFHSGLLTHPLGAIKHQMASLYLSPGKRLSPFASSNSPPPNSPPPHSLCLTRAQQPPPQELCTKRCLHAHIYTTAPTRSLDLYDPGHWGLAWTIYSLQCLAQSRMLAQGNRLSSCGSQAWWYTSVRPGLGRQEDKESAIYPVPCQP